MVEVDLKELDQLDESTRETLRQLKEEVRQFKRR